MEAVTPAYPRLIARRHFLAGATLAVTALAFTPRARGAEAPAPAAALGGFRLLRAAPGSASLFGTDRPPVPVWAFDGIVPGPLLRVRRNEELRIRVRNDLPEPMRVHWHGLRIANAMDGTALTQPPIAPGETFDYRFTPPDAGTFWYRSAFSPGQIDRGLSGVLIVEESEPVAVDREVILVFDDWRLEAGATSAAADPPTGTQGAAREDPRADYFTVNGRPSFQVPVRRNERLRLRLLNATSRAPIAATVEGLPVTVMALDGEPCEPFLARDARVVLGPGNRVDLFLDATLAPGAVGAITIESRTGTASLVRLVCASDAPVRPGAREAPTALPANPLPEKIDLARALKLNLPIADDAGAWSLPAQAANGEIGPPVFTVERGRAVVLAFENRTETSRSVHVHGHHFRLLDRLDDGWKPFWLDTLVLPAHQLWRIAFVADNPGRWMLGCQPLAPGAPGSAAWFAVT
jgi:FtsP/CotA-like multicopper oxidase with cupredoxin domain